MNGVDSLIRLHRWKLDEARRKVTELERLATRLRYEIGLIDEEIGAERRVAQANAEMAGAYGRFVNAALGRRERLLASLAGVEGELVQAQEEVAAAFREYKKFDLIRTRNRRRREERQRREQQFALDEAGLNLYRRREEA